MAPTKPIRVRQPAIALPDVAAVGCADVVIRALVVARFVVPRARVAVPVRPEVADRAPPPGLRPARRRGDPEPWPCGAR